MVMLLIIIYSVVVLLSSFLLARVREATMLCGHENTGKPVHRSVELATG